MSNEYKDNLFYLCSMIEYISRKTHNKPKDIVSKISNKDIIHELKVASVNHCLSFEQVSDEWIEKYEIEEGNFDNIKSCKYNVPTYTSIGKVYQRLILSISTAETIIENIRSVYLSFISDEISNFNSNVYYSNPDYILHSYQEGYLLA